MRTFTNQIETLKRYRSGAQQTVKVEHVYEGGQAIVGNVQTGVVRQKPRIKPMQNLPMHQSKRCGAHSRRTGKPCRNGAMKNGRCRMHGGKATGAPRAIGTRGSMEITRRERRLGGC